jgi:hypothetical protein
VIDREYSIRIDFAAAVTSAALVDIDRNKAVRSGIRE